MHWGALHLLAMRMFEQIERLVARRLPYSILYQAPTIEQLADILHQKNWTPSWSSLVAIRPGSAKPPLFLVPAAATTALSFAPLAVHLDDEQPVYGFDPLGLDGVTPPHDRVEDMAAYYIKEMCQLQPDGPYLLGGTCFGAHVAFEMAQQLETQGKIVGLLIVFDANAPAFGPTWAPPKKTLLYLARRVLRLLHGNNYPERVWG